MTLSPISPKLTSSKHLSLLVHEALLFWGDPSTAIMKAAWAQLCSENASWIRAYDGVWGLKHDPFFCEAMGRKSNGLPMEGIGNCLEVFVPLTQTVLINRSGNTRITSGRQCHFIKIFSRTKKGTYLCFARGQRSRQVMTGMKSVNVLSTGR